MDSATWCRTPAAASAARRLWPEVSKNSSTALFSNEGEFARSTTTCAPSRASLSPSPVMVLMPLAGEAALTSCPPWRRISTAFEPIRPVPPMTTIFMIYPPLWAAGRPLAPLCNMQRDSGTRCAPSEGVTPRWHAQGCYVCDAQACRTMRDECTGVFGVPIGSSHGVRYAVQERRRQSVDQRGSSGSPGPTQDIDL